MPNEEDPIGEFFLGLICGAALMALGWGALYLLAVVPGFAGPFAEAAGIAIKFLGLAVAAAIAFCARHLAAEVEGRTAPMLGGITGMVVACVVAWRML